MSYPKSTLTQASRTCESGSAAQPPTERLQMNWLAAVAAGFICLAGISPVCAQDKAPAPAAGKARNSGEISQAESNARPITVTGEVIDTWCYTSHVMGSGRGAKHAGCARACIAGGVAPGILDDKGNLYIAAKHRGYQGCRDLLLPHVAKRVTVKGWVAEKGGCRVLKITSVKLAAARK